MHDINCPYCGAGQDINHDDGHRQQCNDCEKYFTFATSISYYIDLNTGRAWLLNHCTQELTPYEAEKADCLNGYEHDWKPTRTFPKENTKMRCVMCDEGRKPSESEMQDILQTA